MKNLFDPRQFYLLFTEGMRLTLTGNRGALAGSGEEGSLHLIGGAYTLTLSTVVAWLLYPRMGPGPFLLATMTLSMVLFALVLMGKLAGGLFDPFDLKVTGHLPVSPLTRFLARFAELSFILLILTLNLNLAPAVLLGFKTGGSLAAPFLYLAAGLCAAFFTAGACLVLYMLLARFLGAFKLQGVLLYLHILVTLSIMGFMINIGRLIQSGAFLHVMEGHWPRYYPPAWFAGIPLELLGLSNGSGSTLTAAAALCAALLPLLMAAVGSGRLLDPLGGGEGAGRVRSAPGALMKGFEALFVRASERAAFEFTAIHLARDRGFRLKAYPILGIPILIMALSFSEERHPLFFLFMLYLANAYLSLILAFIPYSDHFQGAWIFEALPAESRASFSRGAEKAFVFRVALPLFALNTLVLAMIWEPLGGGLNALYAFLAGLFLVGSRFRMMRDYPFSRQLKGVVTRDIFGSGFVLFLVFGFLLIVQVGAYRQYLLIGLLIAAMGLLHKARFALLHRKAGESGPLREGLGR